MKKLFVTFLLICMLAIHAAAEVKTLEISVSESPVYGLNGVIGETGLVIDVKKGSTPTIKKGIQKFFLNNVINVQMTEPKEIISIAYTAESDEYSISPETVQSNNGIVGLGKITFENPVTSTKITVLKELHLSKLTLTYQDTEVVEPVFNIADGSEVSPGQEISINKTGSLSTALLANDIKVAGNTYTIPEDAEPGSEIVLTAVFTYYRDEEYEPEAGTYNATASIRVKVKSAIPTPTITKHECAITARSANGGWITGTYTLEIENYGGETLLHTIEASDDNGTGYTMLTDVTFVPQSPSVSGIAAQEAPRTTIAGTFTAKDPFLVDPDRAKDYLFRFSTAIDNQSAETATSQTEVQSPAAEGTTTGIDNITTDAGGTTRYYDIHGVRIDTPVPGAPYIKVCDGKTEKILLQQ